MALLCKVLLILFIIVNQNHFGQCDGDDLNINVDGFMDAFDNAYPTETSVHDSGLNEAEVPAEVPDLAEASLKTKEVGVAYIYLKLAFTHTLKRMSPFHINTYQMVWPKFYCPTMTPLP